MKITFMYHGNKHSVDIPDTLDISVTQFHIDNGKRNVCSQCPIALALLDKLHSIGLKNLWIKVWQVAYFNHDSTEGVAEFVYHMPERAIDFIEAFDNGNHVEPFTFTATRTGTEVLDELG